MRRMLWLSGILALCFCSINLAMAQEENENGWIIEDNCLSLPMVFDEALPSPVLEPVNEGGTSSFVFHWNAVEFNTVAVDTQYVVLLFFEEPTSSLCFNKMAVVESPDTTHCDFARLIDEDFVEGRIWVSLHSRIRIGLTWYYSPVDTSSSGPSLIEAYWDNIAPEFSSAGFSEVDQLDALGLRGTTSSEVVFQCGIDTPDKGPGWSCGQSSLPPVRLYLDELNGFTFDDFELDNEGGKYVNFDLCRASLTLGLTSSADGGRKSLTVHLRDPALNESESDSTFILEYFKPLVAQAYPNPLNLNDGIPVTIQVGGAIKTDTPIRIFGPFGNLIRTLPSDSFNSGDGMSSVTWDGKNGKDTKVSTGVYLYVIEPENGETITGKIAVVQ